MPDPKPSWPAEFYESGENMPDPEAVAARYSPDFGAKMDAEIKAIMERQKAIEPTIKYFIETGYQASNKLLRGQPLRKVSAEVVEAQMVKLDEVLALSKLDEPKTVYRGISQEFAKQLEGALVHDGLFTDVGYVIASTFERHTDYAVQIEVPAGAPCLSLNKYLKDEVLLPHGSRFKVSASQVLPNGKTRFIAQWLGS